MRRNPEWASRILLLKKAATLSLLFSFTLSPIVSFAEEGNQDQLPLIETVSEPDADPSETEGTIPPDTQQDSEEEEVPEDLELVESSSMSSFSGSTQAEGGALFINNESTKSAAPKTDTQSGALSYEYPLTIPPGRNGMEPNLGLAYSSNETDNTSPFGYGWSISIPSIKRISKTGVNHLYSGDLFTSSLDGELMRVGTTTQYVPRVENGEFRRYELESNVWTVTEKSGKTLYFGTTTASRQDNPATSTQVYAWHLEEEVDTNGNYVSYSYFKDAGSIYPDTISYTGHASSTGIFEVAFSRESRADNLVSYKSGFAATSTYRINRIEAKVNGTWVSKYDLSYTTGHNGNRSLLSSITRSGQDSGVSAVTLPATNFTYETYSSGDKGWDQNTSIDIPVNVVQDRSNQDDGARFIDINGDSYPDIVRSFGVDPYPANSAPYGISQQVYLGNGSGWATTTEWTIPAPHNGRFGFVAGALRYGGGYFAYNVDVGARFADVNNDGYNDILWAYHTSDVNIPGGYSYDYEIRDVYINNAVDGWATTTEWTLPSGFLFGTDATASGGGIADVNGDGLPDLYIAGCSSGGSVFLNTGSGWEIASSSTWILPEPMSCAWSDYGTRTVDVNGDGLIDIVRSYASTDSSNPAVSKVYLNTSAGWTHASGWSIPVAFAYQQTSSPYNYGLSRRFVDVNGDNLPDIVSSTDEGHSMPDGDGVYINTGEGWTQDSNWTVPPYFKFTYSSGGKTRYAESGYAEMDFDGDNLIDFVKSGMVDSYPTYPHEESIYVHKGVVPDLLRRIEYPEGGEISVSYEQSARYKDGATLLNPHLESNLNTVETIEYDDGVSSPYTNSFTYGGGEYFFASSTEKQFAGFATTTKTDGWGNIARTNIHQGNASLEPLGEHEDSFGKIGKPFLVEQEDDDGNLFRRVITRWETASTSAPGSAFVFKGQELLQDYDGDADHRDRAMSFAYDQLGNMATSTEWGEVTASTTSGSFVDIDSDKRTTVYTYATSSAGTVLDHPSSETVLDATGQKVRESRFYYDMLPVGEVERGNLTAKEDWIANSEYALSRWTYDDLGLVETEISPRFATTTYTYDGNKLYRALTTNALSHTASSTHDYSSGKILLSSDANGFLHEYVYDGLDRVLSEKGPDPVSGSRVVLTEFDYTDTRNAVSVESNRYLSASSTADVHTYFDGFGRKMQVRTETEVPNEYAVQDWIYGTEGHLVQESLPYFDEDEDDDPPSSDEYLFIEYEYDPLGRQTSISNVLGSSHIDFDQWEKAVTDQLDNVKEYSYDAFERLVGVTEKSATSTYVTSYAWSPNSNLIKITDAHDNERSFEYDGLNRRVAAEDLHAVLDSSYGIWRFAYDHAGNLSSTTDARGNDTVRTYDLLNRPLSEDFLGAAGTEIVYSYDTCTNGVGFLCSATTSGSITSYAYAPSGQTTSETRSIGGTSYVTETVYDRAGNPLEVLYPDSSSVRYSYNRGGRLETIEQKESGHAYRYVVADFDYAPTGQVTSELRGNGLSITRTYDPEELYRLRSIQTATTSTTVIPHYETLGLDDGLVSYYDFASVADSHGPNTLSNLSSVPFVSGGKNGYAADLEASSSQILSITDSTQAGLQFTNELTLAGWVNYESLPALNQDSGFVVKNAVSGNQRSYAFRPINDGGNQKMYFSVTNNGTSGSTFNISNTLSLTTGTWYHVAVTWNAGSYVFYLNGVNVGSGTTGSVTSLYNNTAPVAFGTNDSGSPERYFDGKMDEWALYSEALSSSSISTLYNSGFGNFYATTSVTSTGDPVIQNLSYQYDAVGNITRILDAKDIDNVLMTEYTYDDLYRLTSSQVFEEGGIWYDPSWQYRVKLTIPKEHLVDGLEDFPVYVNLADLPSGFHSHVRSDGGDIRVTESDGETEVARDLVSYSAANDTGELHFRFDGAMSTSTDSDFYIYYGNAGAGDYSATSTFGRNAVWNDYVFVSHDGGLTDSSGNQTPTNSGSVQSLTGKLGAHARDLESSSNNYINLGDNVALDIENATLSAWAKKESGGEMTVIQKSHTSPSTSPYDIWVLKTDSSNLVRGWVSIGGTRYIANASAGNTNDGLYHHLALTHDGGHVRLYLDGQEGAATAASGDIDTNNAAAWIGSEDNGGATAWDGLLDEVRIRDEGLPSSWLAIEYHNQNDASTFYSIGVEATSSAQTIPMYEYDAIGNMVANPIGESFTYAHTGYANPHAVTAVASTTLTYDSNGNLTSFGTDTYSWDYRNRLTAASDSMSTSTYTYDHGDQRVSKTTGGSTTRYPNKFYNVAASIPTKHIFAPDGSLIASVTGTGTTSLDYIHTDHLGSAVLLTDSNGSIKESVTYASFGEIATSTGTTTEQRKYIGENFDTESQLSYLNARYYDGARGQFLSQDPSFLDIGAPGFEQKYDRTLQQHLMNPQALNSYSYAFNNPITHKDPKGELAFLVALGYVFLAYNVLDFGVDAYSASIVFGEYSDQFTQQDRNMAVTELTLDGLGALGGVGLTDEAAELTLNGASAVLDIADQLGNGKYKEAIDRSLRTDSPNSDKNRNPNPKSEGKQQTQNKPGAQNTTPTNSPKPVGWEGTKSQQSRVSDYFRGVFNIK